jgi:hypothetical protein
MININALAFLFIIQFLILVIALTILLAGALDAETEEEPVEVQATVRTDEEMNLDEMWAEAFKKADAEQAIPQASPDEIKSGSEVAPGVHLQKNIKSVKPVPDNALGNKREDYNDKN